MGPRSLRRTTAAISSVLLLVLSRVVLPERMGSNTVEATTTRERSMQHADSFVETGDDTTSGAVTRSDNTRNLQTSSFAYHANYVANFQVLRDFNCYTTSPMVQIACQGPTIRVLNTSDPSILCGDSPRIDEAGWSYLRCNNTCSSDSSCENVYLAIGGSSPEGPFGQVEFQCAGDSLEDVEALLLLEGKTDGTCAPSDSTNSRIFHLAQLGVSCPSTSGNAFEHVYDDYFVECDSGITLPTSGVGERYTCASGSACTQETGCQIEVDPIYVNVSLPAIQNRCVTPTVPLPAPAPISAPTQNSTQPPRLFTYKARFTAAWSLLSNQTSETACASDAATVRIECRNSDALTKIDEPGQNLNCTMVGQMAMDCTKIGTIPVNDFSPEISFVSSMTYLLVLVHLSFNLTILQIPEHTHPYLSGQECSGPELPQSVLLYPANAVTCNGNSLPVDLSNAVQLGVFCRDSDGDDSASFEGVFFLDTMFECGAESHQANYMDNVDSSSEVRWTCLEQATFPIGLTTSQPRTIPSVTILSDWVDTTDTACYTRTEYTSAAPIAVTPPPIMATTVPLIAPISADVPTTLMPIMLSPQVPSSPTTQDGSETSDGSGNNMGFVVGAVAGGAIVAIGLTIVIVVLVLRRSPTNNVKPTQHTQDALSGGAHVVVR